MSDIYHVLGGEDGCAILREYDQFNKCHKYQELAIFTLEQFIIGESLYKIRIFYFLMFSGKDYLMISSLIHYYGLI